MNIRLREGADPQAAIDQIEGPAIQLTAQTERIYWQRQAKFMGIYLSIFVNALALYPIMKFGTEEQKERFLRPFCEKFSLASYCLSEHTVGSGPASMKTRAVLEADHYIVNGTKMWITNGGYADFYLLFANTDLQRKHRGIICLVVPSTLAGISHGEPIDKMGQRASNTAAVTLRNVRVPRENLLAGEGEGFKKALAAVCSRCPLCTHARAHPESWLGRVLHHPLHADHCPFWKAERAVSATRTDKQD